jgi:hypothetical protein
MRARVTTTTRLTDLGKFGAFLFITAPVLLAFRLPIFLRSDSAGEGMFAIACLIAFLAGFILLLTGRTMRHDVVIEPAEKKSSPS